MRLEQLEEYKRASNVLASEGQAVRFDLRMLNLPPGHTVEKAFEEMNAKALSQLPKRSQAVIRALAQRLINDPKWRGSTIAITRIGGSHSTGLHPDDERMYIWALAVKPGARTFTLTLQDLYRKDESKQFLINLMGMAYPPQNPRNFFVMSIPLEDKAIAERVAEESQMRLADHPPVEAVTDSTGQVLMVQYPPQDVPNTFYLINEPGSTVYTEPGSGGELFKIESMLMRGPESEPS